MSHTRRQFLIATAIGCSAAAARLAAGKDQDAKSLAGEVGVTTSSFSGHLSTEPASGKFTLLELPRLLSDELDMRVIDLNTSALASYQPDYLKRVRAAAEKAGCVITNLKLNQRGLDMNSIDESARRKALDEYRRSIDAAALLGARWVRPLPLRERPEMRIHVESYRELADYAAERGVAILVENYGWMQAEPGSVATLIKVVGRDVAACPDTGNWDSDEIRYKGLAQTFPLAVTCDFKARELGPEGQHDPYDLKRCFTIGQQAGFKGPWCLEHANRDRAALFRELALLRDMLRNWMNG